MTLSSSLFVLSALFTVSILCEPSFTPMLPPSYPLAVRNPYLSGKLQLSIGRHLLIEPAWLPGNLTSNLPYASPQFWNGQNLTWSVMARVDGQTYSLFGVPEPVEGVQSGSLISADFTSTHTTFVVDGGSATFTLDFFSPVSPQNYIRQSLPLSYLTVFASVSDGSSHSIQIYSDIDNSWTGQFGENIQTGWTYALTEASTYVLALSPGGTETYYEVNDMAQWGTAVYCTQPGSSTVTAQVGIIDQVWTSFASGDGFSDDWTWQPGSVIAFSHDLATVDSTQHNVTFAVGLVREEAVSYMGQDRANYWHSTTQDYNAACVHALMDYEEADAEGRTLDAEISSKATSVAGSNYSDIVSLSARQVFGAMEITIPYDTLDTSDVMIFVKEISSNGNVNTMDVILPISPILYVMAPEYIRLLLEPVMRYLGSGAWPHNFTIHDIGTTTQSLMGTITAQRSRCR